MEGHPSATAPTGGNQDVATTHPKGNPVDKDEMSIVAQPGLLIPPNAVETKQPSEQTSQQPPNADNEAPHSVFSETAKITIILTASFAAVVSPLSASIYYPALNSLASDLHTSPSGITLTITTYMIFQGLAPSFTGAFSDRYGRRLGYILCFSIYVCANIGLALQNSYAALMVLRCLQSSGSSGTIALGSAVVADLSTRAERGKFIAYAGLGVTLGPALGPVIGGLLDQNLGWRSIFWFLTIFSATFLLVIIVAVPETCRSVVGNGSIPPSKWKLSLIQHLKGPGERTETEDADFQTLKKSQKSFNPFASLKIATEKEVGLVLWYGALMCAGYFAMLSTLSTQLHERYGFDSLKIGLCYLPLGFGSLTSRWTVGPALDRNFRRLARIHNIPIIKNRQQDIGKFPVEIARLQVTFPLIVLAGCSIVAYAWVMQYKTSLAGTLVTLFFVGHAISGAFSTLNTLVVDINKDTPATAVAANNLFRCLIGAGAVAVANPVINRIGIGWTGTLIVFLWILFSPCLYIVWKNGLRWRTEAIEKAEAKKKEKEKETVV